MKIAVCSNYIFTPHYETELELIQKHLLAGDEIIHLVCDMHLLSCDFNPLHDYLKCRFCIKKRQSGIALLNETENYKSIKLSALHADISDTELRLDFQHLSELKEYKIQNFDIGYAALSSLVSFLRNPEPDLLTYRDLLNNILRSAFFMYKAAGKFVEENDLDRFYIFNGRFAINRAIFRACQYHGLEAIIHERGRDLHHFALYHNAMPHEIKPFADKVMHLWNHPRYSEEEKQQIASNFYIERLQGKNQSWFSFTTAQQRNLLPEGWDPEKKNIVIFNSSEDEFVAIGEEWRHDFFTDQLSLIQQLAEEDRLAECTLWLRMHPNMAAMHQGYSNKYDVLRTSNIHLIEPTSKVSSYDLLLAASKVLTFGSTMGIEATYWGKPSILVGTTFYKFLDVTYNAADFDELIQLLLEEDILPKKRENTLPYGFYLKKFGEPYHFYQPATLFKGEFKGKDLDQPFDLTRWRSLTNRRGFHRLYNRLKSIHLKNLLKQYV